MKWLDELNSEQRRAVEAPDGAVMIGAGPGTGKTRTLVARVAWLLEQGVAPTEILALTFTHKAAREMGERLAAVVEGGPLPEITTFHGFGYGLLQKTRGEDARRFVSDAERLEVVRELRRAAGVKDLSTRELGLALSRFKNAPESGDATVAELARRYSEKLQERGWRDFDDLLGEVLALLSAQTDAMRYRHVLVDEFQDTSPVQYEIAKRLAVGGSLFVIGDANQSIYGFRGASGEVFERFGREFPEALEVRFRENYRSAASVVAVGNAVFGDEVGLVAAGRERAGQIRMVETLNDYSEADWVVDEIERAVGGTDFQRVDATAETGLARGFREFAVIYRTHAQNRALRRRLDESGIPYQVIGGGSVYEQPSARRVTEVLRALAGLATDGGELAAAERELLVSEFESQVGATPVADLVERIGKKLGLGEDSELSRFAGLVVRFGSDVAACVRYLDELAATDYYDPAAEAVTLTTIHAAKGLEFDYVFVCGCEEGVLPHARAGADDVGLAEERRLFYVAVTRARERLDLLWTRGRGGRVAVRSRFLDGLPGQQVLDPAMPALLRKRARRAQERAQGTLF